MKPITIAGRPIGPDYPVYIVVEAGTTANGDVDTACLMIDAAKVAGADAIKFMIIGADFFMSRRDVEYSYDTEQGRRSENMYEMFKKLETPAYKLSSWDTANFPLIRKMARTAKPLGEAPIIFRRPRDEAVPPDRLEELAGACLKHDMKACSPVTLKDLEF